MKRLPLYFLLLLPLLLNAQTGIPAWDDKPDLSWDWRRFGAKIILGSIYGTNGSHANVVFFGDSMAARKQWMAICTLTNMLPIASVGMEAVSMDGTGSQGDQGGAFQTQSDYSKWITGQIVELEPGDTGRFYPSPTFMQGQPWFNANRLSVCVLTEPGAGTLDVYAQQYGGGSPNFKVGEIDTASVSTSAFWVHYSVTNFSAWNIVVSNTHASAKASAIGCAFADTNLSGIGLWSLAKGGASLHEMTNSNPLVFSNVMSGIDADLILSEWKEGNPPGYVAMYSTALELNYMRFTNSLPKAEWVHFATHNDTSENYTTQNSATWYHCKRHGLGFVDMQRVLKSPAAMNNAFMGGDSVHGNNVSDIFSGIAVAESLGFPALLDFLTARKTVAPSMTKLQRDAIYRPDVGRMIYQTDSTPGLRVRTANGWVRFTETVDP